MPERNTATLEQDAQLREDAPNGSRVVGFKIDAAVDPATPWAPSALDSPAAPAYLDDVYAERFSDADAVAKNGLWREIVRYLSTWIPRDGAVLDVACDRGYFIRNVEAREAWATDVRDMSADMAPGIRFVQADGLKLLDHLPASHFDVVFLSNYLEHLSSAEAVIEQLRVARQLVRPGGRVVILQPNIRLVGGAYWDFIDHKVALTDRSLREAADITGLETEHVVVRFLPYTTKSRLGARPWLVRAYLAIPLAWRVLGRQTLFIARRAA